eukprot:31447-Prymnesium_polylepis.2
MKPFRSKSASANSDLAACSFTGSSTWSLAGSSMLSVPGSVSLGIEPCDAAGAGSGAGAPTGGACDGAALLLDARLPPVPLLCATQRLPPMSIPQSGLALLSTGSSSEPSSRCCTCCTCCSAASMLLHSCSCGAPLCEAIDTRRSLRDF